MKRKQREHLTEQQIFARKRLEKLRRYCEAYWDMIPFEHGAWGNQSARLDSWDGQDYIRGVFDPVQLDDPNNFWVILQSLKSLAWDSKHTYWTAGQAVRPYSFAEAWDVVLSYTDQLLAPSPPPNRGDVHTVRQSHEEARRKFDEIKATWRRYVIKQQQEAARKEKARHANRQVLHSRE